MKTRILILALLLTGFSYSFAAATDGINKQVASSFSKDFSNARDVKWAVQKDFVIATFTVNDNVMFAYYKTDGELMAVARNILSDKLPISQSLSLKKDYSDYWISNLFEVFKNNQSTYYVTVENADEKLVLQSTNNEYWEVYSKSGKK